MPGKMSRIPGRMRPAGESSDEDEYRDYMSDDNGDIPLQQRVSAINLQERENERIFQLFLNGTLYDITTLLNEGFDVNTVLRDKWTPLLLAASVGMPNVTALLISKGADVNAHRDYYTPLMAAAACPETTSAFENSLAIVKQLISNNAEITAKTRKRVNALMYAASIGNYEVVKELLPLSDKMAEDNQGWTVLFWAMSGNNVEVVKLLIEEGLPCNKFDVRGNLPINYAKENDFVDIIAILPNLKEEKGLYVFKEYGYQDFFDIGSSDFIQDIVRMLYGMKNEYNSEYFINNQIHLYQFLILKEEELEYIGVKMPYERYRILSGLHRFHKHPFKSTSLPIIGKTEPYSTVNVANTVLAACRQFICMQASLRYILRNVTNFRELQGCSKEIEAISNTLNKINNVVRKINEKAVRWDRETRPADLITKESCKIIRSSKLQYFIAINVLSIVGYMLWMNYK